MDKNTDINCIKKECHITSIGGQAVMEGVMMRGPKKIATAVRKASGEIIIDEKPVNSVIAKSKILKLPIIRGIISFFESMITGVKCLMFSADGPAGPGHAPAAMRAARHSRAAITRPRARTRRCGSSASGGTAHARRHTRAPPAGPASEGS